MQRSHPFYVKDKGWTAASELEIDDLLSTHEGKWIAIEDLFDTGQLETVYNLRVADYHTYFVGARDWSFSVWVHNSYSQVEREFRGIAQKIYSQHLANGGQRGPSPTMFWRDILRGSRRRHIIHGEIYPDGNVGGGHWAHGDNINFVTMTSARKNRHGAYKAIVDIGDASGVVASKRSTKFNDTSTPADIYAQIYSAYLNARYVRGSMNSYEGISKTGQKISMYLDGGGPQRRTIYEFPNLPRIISSYPKRRP